MKNADELLKRILLNMRYDPKMSLNENKVVILSEDNPNKRDTKEYWDGLLKKGKVDQKTYDYHIDRIIDLDLNKSFTGAVKRSSGVKSEIDTKEYDNATYVTYQTVMAGKTLSFPITWKGLQPLKWHDKNEPFNEFSAKYFFGKSCMRLSGQDPNYKLGVNDDKDFYVDNLGNRCLPINEHEYNVGCKPLPFDVCLKWSWKSLMEFGGVDKGLKRFSYQKDKDTPIIYYSACVKKNELPWLYVYDGFFDESKIVSGSYDETLKQKTGGYCDRNSISKLPTVPSVEYGKNNKSSSDPEEMDRISTIYASEQGKYYHELSGTERELYGSTKQNVDQIKSVTLNGLRIKGK